MKNTLRRQIHALGATGTSDDNPGMGFTGPTDVVEYLSTTPNFSPMRETVGRDNKPDKLGYKLNRRYALKAEINGAYGRK